jgi:DNA-binding CsgD family transcriptional regulator
MKNMTANIQQESARAVQTQKKERLAMLSKDKLPVRVEKDILVSGDGMVTMVDLPLRILFNTANFDGRNIIDVALGQGARVLGAPGLVSDGEGRPLNGHSGGRVPTIPAATVRWAPQARQAALSAREMDVLKLIAKGLRNKEIGAELKIAEDTVKIHIKNIFGKLQVHDRTRAVVTASQLGIIHLEEVR